MPASYQRSNSPPGETNSSRVLAGVILLAGLGARLFLAWRYFFNPDEALHVLCAHQSSLQTAYRAALTNAHPPLLILVLYYWRWLGQSEFILRLPSVLAGTLCCWLVYKWLRLIADRSTALIGLMLMSFAPSLVALSAEVRQYALLLMFMAACLYFSERALRENSPRWMIAFSVSLFGALLTHYSSLFFALSMGVYMLMRLRPYGNRLRLVIWWAAGQIVGAAIAAYFLSTHLMRLQESGLIRTDNETYLRRYLFHSGENNVFVFIPLQTLRVFTFLFSHGLFGTLALLAFLTALVLLILKRVPKKEAAPSAREPALILVLPFVLAVAAALAGAYPYGATRHVIFLTPFAVAGIAFALGSLFHTREQTKILIIAAALTICNFFPSPPPMIRARNQSRRLMLEAAALFERSAPPRSIVLADYQSALEFGYYVCPHGFVQIFPPFEDYAKADCGPYTVIAPSARRWKFYADDFDEQLRTVAKRFQLAPETKVWLFDAGWINDSTPALRPKFAQLGCPDPQTFGENILICELKVPKDSAMNGELDPGSATVQVSKKLKASPRCGEAFSVQQSLIRLLRLIDATRRR